MQHQKYVELRGGGGGGGKGDNGYSEVNVGIIQALPKSFKRKW
jgi:hypothetical protein